MSQIEAQVGTEERIDVNANKNLDALRVAIIGFGKIALAHVRAIELRRDLRLVGFSTSDQRIQSGDCRHLTCNLGVDGFLFKTEDMQHIVSDWKQLLECTDIDAFIVCAPTKFHCEIAIAIAKTGRHCYLEKPIADTTFNANWIVSDFEKSGGKLVVGQELAAFPAFNYLYQILKKNPPSRVKKLTLRRRVPWLDATGHDEVGPSQIAKTTGFAADLMVHDINLLLHWNNPGCFQIMDRQKLHGKIQRVQCRFFHESQTVVMMDVGASMDVQSFAHSWYVEFLDEGKNRQVCWYEGKDVWQSSGNGVAQKVVIESMTTPQVIARTLGIFADYCAGKRRDPSFLDSYIAYKTMQVIQQLSNAPYAEGELRNESLALIFIQ